jgi:hypothetical protein
MAAADATGPSRLRDTTNYLPPTKARAEHGGRAFHGITRPYPDQQGRLRRDQHRGRVMELRLVEGLAVHRCDGSRLAKSSVAGDVAGHGDSPRSSDPTEKLNVSASFRRRKARASSPSAHSG